MRSVPVALQAHLEGRAANFCRIIKIGPLPDGSYRPLAFLDQNVAYDDGEAPGLLTYIARTGAQMSAFVSTSDMTVDNAEMDTLPPVEAFPLEGFTRAQIEAGHLDKVEYVVYGLDYLDTSKGHFIWCAGTLGEVRVKNSALFNLEQRSLTQQLLQSVLQLDSKSCRAKFGSQPFGTNDGSYEERFPCGYHLSAEWIEGTVLDIGEEYDRDFIDTSLTQDADWFVPGVVEWLTGSNAGQQQEVEAFESATVTLQFPTVNPILLGDTFRIRRDCRHVPSGHNSCRTFFDVEWVRHYRGEPWIPTGDTGKLNSPGAGVAGNGVTGTGEVINTPNVPVPPEEGPPPGGGDDGGVTTGLTRTRGATVVDVADYGAVGDGTTDDTAAFNAAYAALPGDGGTVVAGAATYLINSVVSIKPVSNTLLDLTAGAVLKVKTNTVNSDFCIFIDEKSNVEIAGGKITGDLDTFVPQSGTTSEHGHGVCVQGSQACTVRDMTIDGCVGDGVYVGSLSGQDPTTDIKIDNCIITRSRRNNISITADVDACQITRSEIAYAGSVQGTSPKYGIDIEPNASTGKFATNTLIDHCNIHHNVNGAIQVRRNGNDTTITNNTIERNGSGIYTVGAIDGTVTGNTIRHQKNAGLHMGEASTGYSVSGNTFFDNKIGNGAGTDVGTLTTRTGTSTATSKHISISSDSSATVGANDYGP